MQTKQLERYTDYLMASRGKTTATDSAASLEDEISHNQVTRFLSEEDTTLPKELWLGVEATVHEIESEDTFFDDTIQEKA